MIQWYYTIPLYGKQDVSRLKQVAAKVTKRSVVQSKIGWKRIIIIIIIIIIRKNYAHFEKRKKPAYIIYEHTMDMKWDLGTEYKIYSVR